MKKKANNLKLSVEDKKIVDSVNKQISFIPKKVWLDNDMYDIEIVSDELKMNFKGTPLKTAGRYDRGTKKITLLAQNSNIGETALHEILHLLIESSGFTGFRGSEEEMLVRILTRGIKSYLVACQSYNQQSKTKTKKKIKSRKK